MVTTRELEFETYNQQNNYLTNHAIKPNKLGGFRVPAFATL